MQMDYPDGLENMSDDQSNKDCVIELIEVDGKKVSKTSTGKRKFHHKSKSGCDHCKRRRVKCSMEKPFCHNCMHMNLECVYTPVQPRKKKSSRSKNSQNSSDGEERSTSNESARSTSNNTTIHDSNVKSEIGNEDGGVNDDLNNIKKPKDTTIYTDMKETTRASRTVKKKSSTKKTQKSLNNDNRHCLDANGDNDGMSLGDAIDNGTDDNQLLYADLSKDPSRKNLALSSRNKSSKKTNLKNNKRNTVSYVVRKPDGTKVTIEKNASSSSLDSLKYDFSNHLQNHGNSTNGGNANGTSNNNNNSANSNNNQNNNQQSDQSNLLLPPLMPPNTLQQLQLQLQMQQQQQQSQSQSQTQPPLLPQLMTLTNSEKFAANEYPLNSLLNSPQSTGMNLTNSIGTFFSLSNAKMLTNLTTKSGNIDLSGITGNNNPSMNNRHRHNSQTNNSKQHSTSNGSKMLRTPVSSNVAPAVSKLSSPTGMFQPGGIGGITYDFHELLGSKMTGSNPDNEGSGGNNGGPSSSQTMAQNAFLQKMHSGMDTSAAHAFPSLSSAGSTPKMGSPNGNQISLSMNGSQRLDSKSNPLTQFQQDAKDEAVEVLSTMASVAQRNKNMTSMNNYNKRPHKKPLIPHLQELQSRNGGGSLNLIDLKLFQHYCNEVCSTITDAGISDQQIWFFEIPNLAFQYPFLMHSLLAFSATHLARTEVGLETIVASHRLDALRLLREAVLHITPENTDALVASSIILIMDSLANAASPVNNDDPEAKQGGNRQNGNPSDPSASQGQPLSNILGADAIRKAMTAAAAAGVTGSGVNDIPSMVANIAAGASGAPNLSTSAWIFHVKGAATILTAVWPLPETSRFYNLINVDLSELGNLLTTSVVVAGSQTGETPDDGSEMDLNGVGEEIRQGSMHKNRNKFASGDLGTRDNGNANNNSDSDSDFENSNTTIHKARYKKGDIIHSTITDLLCFDDAIADLYPVEIDSPYLITLAYLDKLNKEKNKSGFILRIFAFPALLDKTFLALLMTGDLNAMRIMRCYYKMLRGFASEFKDKIWFLEGITQVLPVDVDEYSGGGVYMMLDFLGNGLPSMNTTNFDSQQPWSL